MNTVVAAAAAAAAAAVVVAGTAAIAIDAAATAVGGNIHQTKADWSLFKMTANRNIAIAIIVRIVVTTTAAIYSHTANVAHPTLG